MAAAAAIFTIYTECDMVIAQAMSDEGKVRLMPHALEHLPAGHAVNELGLPALAVVSIPRKMQGEYERRVSALRA